MTTSTKVMGWPVLVLASMLALCVAAISANGSAKTEWESLTVSAQSRIDAVIAIS